MSKASSLLKKVIDEESNLIEKYNNIFTELLPKLLKKHEGEWTVIAKDEKPLGFYDTENEAYKKGKNEYGNVPMLVSQVSKGALPLFIYSKPLNFVSPRVSFE